MTRTIVALAACGCVALSVCGCQRTPAPQDEPRRAAGPTPAVQSAPPAPRAESGPAGTLRHVPACDLITRDEMSGLAGGAIGKPSGENSERQTTCTYPPGDAGSYAQAEITIEWDHGSQPSFERQLSGAFSGTAIGRQVAHDIPLGDEAAYSMEGVLSIRAGRTLVTVSLPMRPGAEERAIAIGKKLCERLGIAAAPRVDAPAPAQVPTSTAHDATSAQPPAPAQPPPPPPLATRSSSLAAVEPRTVGDGLVIGGQCPPGPVDPPPPGPHLVPLIAGLTLGHVWKPHSASGTEEYECLIQVADVTPIYADVTYTCNGRDEVPRRRLCLADLRASHVYLTEAGLDQPPVVSGATMFSLSSRSLEELKSSGNTPHRYIEIGTDWQTLPKPLTKDTEGNLHSGRFDRETYKVIVNDKTVELPVLTGIAFGNKPRQTLVTVLDDATLPLVLDYQVPGEEFELRYTKISFPTQGEIEKRLAVDKHVDVYGIYFDFGSDHLRPESAPVLREIADALTKNADWKLSVNGHTDGIGNDAANLALSRRRSDAVRKALVDQYRIDPARLATAGFGASQPKASNATVEGRALNRRVELVRQ